ncbi:MULTISPECIES: hypothetical protein [unclassified Mesorhizobium]|uniref:hypothetical protein n=1 Tax=unclassified Mesorhizobium TaxID=325217 RepID=UPI00333862B7
MTDDDHLQLRSALAEVQRLILSAPHAKAIAVPDDGRAREQLRKWIKDAELALRGGPQVTQHDGDA